MCSCQKEYFFSPALDDHASHLPVPAGFIVCPQFIWKWKIIACLISVLCRKIPLPNNELHAALHLFITYWERRLRPGSESGIERSQSGTFPVPGDGYRAGACIVELRAHSNSIRTTFRLPSRTQSPFKLNHPKKPPEKIGCTGGRGVNQVE